MDFNRKTKIRYIMNEPTIEPGSSRYCAVHNWIKRHFGKAIKCESVECKNKSTSFEWALRKNFLYEKSINNFIQLCVPCHRKYDYSGVNKKAVLVAFEKGRIGRKRPVIKFNINGEELGRYESVSSAAKEHGCAHTSILDAIKSNTKVHGFKWQYAQNK